MQIHRQLLSGLEKGLGSNTQDRFEPHHAVGMRKLVFGPVSATTAIPLYRELSQAQYDKAITDKHIQSLKHVSALTEREELAKTEISSDVTKATNIVLNSPSRAKNTGKLIIIMIVDDEQDFTFLFKVILESAHPDPIFSFKVDSFNDSLFVMQNYREVLYDLIIIDIVMPKMDGFKLFKELGIKRQQREGDILDCGGDVL
jgi:PleD family two-component response regulator